MKKILGKLKQYLIIFGMATSGVVILICMFGLILFGNRLADNVEKPVYNCSIAEISPDFTPAMREQCRKLMREQYEKDLLRKGGTTVQAGVRV